MACTKPAECDGTVRPHRMVSSACMCVAGWRGKDSRIKFDESGSEQRNPFEKVPLISQTLGSPLAFRGNKFAESCSLPGFGLVLRWVKGTVLPKPLSPF